MLLSDIINGSQWSPRATTSDLKTSFPNQWAYSEVRVKRLRDVGRAFERTQTSIVRNKVNFRK